VADAPAAEPDDYVIATGEMHSRPGAVRRAFASVGLDPDDYVVIDPSYFRPTEVDVLLGDAGKAERVLGWKPQTTFHALVRIMVEADIREVGLDPDRYLRDSPG
jgi:GDPmannose 4,6-dehydratase